MERDCLISHGAAEMLRERLFTQSDHYTVPICQNCGLIAYENAVTNELLCCPRCSRTAFEAERSDTVKRVEIPYACKLLFQELMAMNIVPRIELAPNTELGVKKDLDPKDCPKVRVIPSNWKQKKGGVKLRK
jgi:DNA-directed RNA polymerase II subunit RPB2